MKTKLFSFVTFFLFASTNLTIAYDYDDVQDLVDQFDPDNSWENIADLVDLTNYYGEVGFYINSTRKAYAYECSLAAEYIYDVLQDSIGYDISDSCSAHIPKTYFIDIPYTWTEFRYKNYGCPCEPYCAEDSTLGLGSHRIIVASVKDSTASDTCIVLVAHYDTERISGNPCSLSPGAFDGASGVSSILEMARISLESICDYNFNYTMKFMFFTEHEFPGANWGSRYYNAEVKSDDSPILAVLGISNFGVLDPDDNNRRDIQITFCEEDSLPFTTDLCNLWLASIGKYASLDSLVPDERVVNGDDSGTFLNDKGGGNPELQESGGFWGQYEENKACRGFDVWGDLHYDIWHAPADTLGNLTKSYFKEESKGTLGTFLTLALDMDFPDQTVGCTPLSSKHRGANWNSYLSIGDTLYYRFDAINHTSGSVTGDFWATIQNTGGGGITVAKTHLNMALVGWESKFCYRKVLSPSNGGVLPDSTGTYIFQTNIGEYDEEHPDEGIADSDTFTFVMIEE